MKVETVLPFGKLDPGLRAARDSIDLSKFFDQCELVEELGYNALSVTETKLDPFIQLALGAQATNSVELHTAVAIAFPRSPTVTAQAAWTLQALSGGRLNLGLGTRVTLSDGSAWNGSPQGLGFVNTFSLFVNSGDAGKKEISHLITVTVTT